MAKQTFTTGQVLTAAQMTSLQQTAMGGGEATAKTASYVLTAADAGTTVIMNAAGATTITVNTALFAAGDTVNIQNISAGICTVTAGTATVNTAGSLALNQYEGGVLYFRSASAATFFDYVQTGSVSPLTTKGDLYGFSTLDARIPIGTNNQVLTADSAQALGLKWATPSAPDKTFTLISTTALSGSSVTVTGITGDTLYLHITGVQSTSASAQVRFRINGDSGAKYGVACLNLTAAAAYAPGNLVSQTQAPDTTSAVRLAFLSSNTGSVYAGAITILGAASSIGVKTLMFGGAASAVGGDGNEGNAGGAIYTGTTPAAITNVTLLLSAGTFSGGSLSIYKG